MQTALHEEEEAIGPSLTRSFAAARCTVISLFQMPLPEYEKLVGSMGTNCPFGPPAEFERYRQSAACKADFNLCLDYFSNWLAVASAPFPACLEAAGQWAPEADAQISDAKAKGYRVAATMLPALTAAMEKAADCVGQLRAAQAALAVERYRLVRPCPIRCANWCPSISRAFRTTLTTASLCATRNSPRKATWFIPSAGTGRTTAAPPDRRRAKQMVLTI